MNNTTTIPVYATRILSETRRRGVAQNRTYGEVEYEWVERRYSIDRVGGVDTSDVVKILEEDDSYTSPQWFDVPPPECPPDVAAVTLSSAPVAAVVDGVAWWTGVTTVEAPMGEAEIEEARGLGMLDEWDEPPTREEDRVIWYCADAAQIAQQVAGLTYAQWVDWASRENASRERASREDAESRTPWRPGDDLQ